MNKAKKNKEKNIPEQELLDTIDRISKKLAYKFKFGYHEIEDMRQQISIFAIEGLAKYDHQRPLENFLWTHVRNRLYNYKRDNYQRPDKPCDRCPFFDCSIANKDRDCKKYTNKLDCTEYAVWDKRNRVKKNLMYFTTVEELQGCIQNRNNQNHEYDEILRLLDEHLYGEERVSYLKIKYGSKISKQENNKLLKKIKEILDE